MLEKILDYQEKRKQKKKEMEPKKLEIYLIIFGIAIIILLLNNIFGDGNTSKSNNTSKLKAFVTAERLDIYFNKIKKLGRVVFLYRCGTVKSTITDLIFRFPLTSFLGFPVQNPLPRTVSPPFLPFPLPDLLCH